MHAVVMLPSRCTFHHQSITVRDQGADRSTGYPVEELPGGRGPDNHVAVIFLFDIPDRHLFARRGIRQVDRVPLARDKFRPGAHLRGQIGRQGKVRLDAKFFYHKRSSITTIVPKCSA